jgi:hypothetical protein
MFGTQSFSDIGSETSLRKFYKYLVGSTCPSYELRCHLNMFPARSKTLAKLGMDWQEMLKRATTSDD